MTALDVQIGGSHYRAGGIQPVQYIEANGLGNLEGCALTEYPTGTHYPVAHGFDCDGCRWKPEGTP